jgi:HD-like signal output (HDOD) protein
VLDQLRKLTARKELDVRALAKVINQDPGLTALLFKVVGNRAYRQHQPFDSVEQILHAVGVRQTFNLVQAISLISMGDVQKNRVVYETFWARSQEIAQLAMLIADERIAVCNLFPDQAYLAGMFHDCGVLLLMQRFPTYCAEMKLRYCRAVDQPARRGQEIQRRSLCRRLSRCPSLAFAGLYL